MILAACSKVTPLVTGNVYYQIGEDGAKKNLKEAVLNFYPLMDNEEDSIDTYTKNASYRTTANSKGKYRIEAIGLGEYLVVVLGNVNGTSISDTSEIKIDKEKRYKCDITVTFQ